MSRKDAEEVAVDERAERLGAVAIIAQAGGRKDRLRKAKGVIRAPNFLKRALRCFSSQRAKTRASWEQLRASLRRKDLGYSPYLRYFTRLRAGLEAGETGLPPPLIPVIARPKSNCSSSATGIASSLAICERVIPSS